MSSLSIKVSLIKCHPALELPGAQLTLDCTTTTVHRHVWCRSAEFSGGILSRHFEAFFVLFCRAPTHGVVSCTCEQRSLHFRLGCHGLPVLAGRLAGAGHDDKAYRVCICYRSGPVGAERHLVLEYAALVLAVWQRCASLSTGPFLPSKIIWVFPLCDRLFGLNEHVN